MLAFPMPEGGSLVLGTAGQPDTLAGTANNDIIVGADAGELLFGAAGNDLMIGGGGADVFAFTHATAPGKVDVVYDFQSGQDVLDFINVSPKEVTPHDTPQGLEIWYGGLGGIGADHAVVLLWGVHEVQPAHDLVFT